MRKDDIQQLLTLLQFSHKDTVYTKQYPNANEPLKIDICKDGYIYYHECGITIGRETTCNLLEPENLVVLQCVDQLLEKGYSPHHIELEPGWKLGHTMKGGYADVWVRTFPDNHFDGAETDKESLLIIECKTWGREFDGAWADTCEDGGQLFSYFQQERSTKFLCLYTADIINGKVETLYHLINVQDNEEKLAIDDSLSTYKEATNNKQLFSVWHDTYQCDYATRGLMEPDIEPYHIGKRKYTIGDLRTVGNDSIERMYNEFALILRQHNVGGHENAFDKLVNLFLAKVVDETNNPYNLHFHWKGAAYDDDYSLQDRLQRLYRDGMKRFLNEDVTYVENEEIEKAFRRFKADPDATKKTIMEFFRALKFFSNNDFAFINVHNKKLFEQNAAVLRKVVKMLQEIRLKENGQNQNQLLGNLFEGFLTKGVKQSEGQFFTPMPIVRFIVTSLPLERIISQSEDIPSAIDYACGAGHFLTEYAVQIAPFVKCHRNIPLQEYYAHTMGIEKEYRLSKVSKVSAFMYGHDETRIVYADALVPHPDVHEGTFDVLIANPPYSVKGFLEMLTDQQRRHYTLFNDDISTARNNAIETFFIERAAQLLRAGGVAGIVMPISILNKDGIYARAREIILRQFEVVALAEFGNGTFGKTGTNTVTMFLRRKETNTPDADHYRCRVDSWFQDHHEGDAVYVDEHLLSLYCEHCGFATDDYKLFLQETMTEEFLGHDTIKAYKESFFGNQRNAMKGVCDKAKDIRARLRSRQNTTVYRHMTDSERNKVEQKAFWQFIVEIEHEKVFFFLLAISNPNPVIIVKAPQGNTENKRFLGYEWSDSKAYEGIRYLNIARQYTADDEGNNDGDETFQQLQGIESIATPLFNPRNLEDENRINTLIRKNFCRKHFCIPEKLSSFVCKKQLVDMLNFSLPAFTKEFKTTFVQNNSVESHYPTDILENLLTPVQGEKTKIDQKEITKEGAYPVITQESGRLISGYTNNSNSIKDLPLIVFGDHSCALKYIDFEFVRGADGTQLLKGKPDVVDTKYLFYYLSSTSIHNAGKYERHFKYLKKMSIPLPPFTIQKQIVTECEDVDNESQKACALIAAIKEEMESTMAAVKGHQLHLGDVMSFATTHVNIKDVANENYITTDNMLQQYEGVIPFDGLPAAETAIAYEEGDILISNIRPYLHKIWQADRRGGCSPDVLVLRKTEGVDVDVSFLYYCLRRDIFFDHVMSDIKGMKMPRGKRETISRYLLELPAIEEQKAIANQMRHLDEEIAIKKQLIAGNKEKKKRILAHYLT